MNEEEFFDADYDNSDMLDSTTPYDENSVPTPLEQTLFSNIDEDMSFASTEEDVSKVKFWVQATEWHPFMRYFVRIANLLYPTMPAASRPNMLAARHSGIFWTLLVLDVLFLFLLSFGCIAVICLAVYKIFFM